jgi:hypothetical protein
MDVDLPRGPRPARRTIDASDPFGP